MFTFEPLMDQEATMSRMGHTYEHQNVQMKRVVVETLLTQADLLPGRRMY